MNNQFYSKSVVTQFLKKNLFFGDKKLEKYFEDGDVSAFRKRVPATESFDKMIYVMMTNTLRDIIYEILGEVTSHMKPMGDTILSGGDAFNIYMDYDNRLITTDIDAKFVPRMKPDSKFFGKLQATKLILWDKLGEISKRFSQRLKSRIESNKRNKIYKFMGINTQNTKPTLTRRYTLIKKKKTGTGNQPSEGDVFIDVELFALDLTLRYFSPKSGKIETQTIGGILDIPFMRPNEFGYEVAKTGVKGITYIDQNSNRFKTNNKIFVASKKFLIEDIYLMSKLGLRPEKKQKDRQRLIRLTKAFGAKNTRADDSIETLFKKVKPFIRQPGTSPKITYNGKVSFSQASRVNPYKYENYTSKPDKSRLSKQIVYGLNPMMAVKNIKNYNNSHGNQRFNLDTLKWTTVDNTAYVKNEFKLRPTVAKSLPKERARDTLYGYNPERDVNVPKNILDKAGAIPFIGLKN